MWKEQEKLHKIFIGFWSAITSSLIFSIMRNENFGNDKSTMGFITKIWILKFSAYAYRILLRAFPDNKIIE